MAFAGSLAKADILLQNCLQRQEVRRSIVRDAQQTMVRSMRKHCEALASQDVPGARHGVVHLCDALAADDVAGLALALTESGQVSFEVRSGCTKVLQNDLERSTFGRSTCSRANIAAVADLVAAGIVLPAVALRCCSLHGTGGQLPERVSKRTQPQPRQTDTAVSGSPARAVAPCAADTGIFGSAPSPAADVLDSSRSSRSPNSCHVPSRLKMLEISEAGIRRQLSFEIPNQREHYFRRSSMPAMIPDGLMEASQPDLQRPEPAGQHLQGEPDGDHGQRLGPILFEGTVSEVPGETAESPGVVPSSPDCPPVLRKRDTYVEVKMKDGTWRTGRIEGVLPGDFFGMTFWRPDGSEFRMRVSRRAQMRRMKRAQDTLEVGSSVQVKMPNGVWRRGQVHQAMGGDGFVVKFLRRDGSEALMRVPGSAAVRPDQGPPGADRHVEVKIGDNWVDAFLIGVCDNQEFRVLLSGEHDSREILVPGDTPVRPILGSNRTKHQD
mmetsp:Transcript_20598/g.52378  ORF Transcript_20598/g.52378 Transcript_20598/m.52378 type:complete len:495 (-) Transcript_20598:210-1694(-)